MAVRKNPFTEWQFLKRNSDYRNTDTQLISYVRQQLSEPEYLRKINRVNPGPWRNKRVKFAESISPIPTVFGPEDMWGFQSWTEVESQLVQSSLTTGEVYIEYSPVIPGTSYLPYNRVGGATYIPTPQFGSCDITLLDSDYPSIRPQHNFIEINGIPVDIQMLNEYSDNYVMIYKSQLNRFTFVSPSYVLGSADEDGNIDTIDFGMYS